MSNSNKHPTIHLIFIPFLPYHAPPDGFPNTKPGMMPNGGWMRHPAIEF